MFLQPVLNLLNSGLPLFGGSQAIPVRFDEAATTRLARGANLTGIVDTKLVTGSFWIYPRSLGGNRTILETFSNETTHRIRFTSANTIEIRARNAVGTNILSVVSTGTLALNTWHHIHYAIDMADQPSSFLKINGIESISVTTFTDDSIGFSVPTDWHVGANDINGNVFSGDLAEFWFDNSFVTDTSIFSNGTTPTGSYPSSLILFSGDLSTWSTNDGTGGGFSIATGALTEGQSPVSL